MMKLFSVKVFSTVAGILILLSSQLASAVSADSKLIFDGRADSLTQSYNDDANTPGGARPNNSTFRVASFRLDFMGKLGTDNLFRIRMNLPQVGQSAVGYPGPADNISPFLDYAYISRNLTENLTLIVGKQWGFDAGWVGTYDPADIYLSPKAYAEIISSFEVYATGATLHYDTATQKFWFGVVDPGIGSTDSGTATGNPNNGRQTLTGRWFGSFLDKMLQATVNYSTETRQNQTPSPKNVVYNYAAAGLRFTTDVCDVDLDYLLNTYADRTTAGQTDSTNSLFIFAHFKMPDSGLKPVIGYENSTQKFETSATVEKKISTASYIAGLEYYPKKDEDFRYHIMYTNQPATTDLGTGVSSSQNQQQLIVGVRMKMDLLK